MNVFIALKQSQESLLESNLNVETTYHTIFNGEYREKAVKFNKKLSYTQESFISIFS